MKIHIYRWCFYAALNILMVCLAACNPEEETPKNEIEDPLKPEPVITTTISGVVVDEQGFPVSNAEILIEGETTSTDEVGGFLLNEIEVPGNRCVVRASKEGYFPASRAHDPAENSKTDVRLVLMASPVTHTFDAASGISATVDGGSLVEIAANSLATESGESYSGPVNMSVRYLDPAAGNFGVLVPGGDMVATREDQTTSILYSYGILRVTMRGEGDQPLQLAAGTTSTLTMAIPASQAATAPETIPLWYFDESKGVWVEDGTAQKEGDKYVGTVTHFTDWNCDDPTEGATIIGRLIDCDGNPAWGQVEFGQIATDPQSYTETGESDGRFNRRVPDGVQLTVVISDPLMISPLTQNERGKVIVIVPPLSPGQVYDVGDIQTFPCPVKVKATIKTKEGDQVYSVYFSSDFGVKSLYETGETLQTTLPPNQTFSFTVYTTSGLFHSQEIQTPNEGEELDLGTIDLSGTTVIEEEVTITGKTLCFSQPETQGQISVSWQNDSGTAFNYTSPAADGTFAIAAPINTTVVVRSSTEHGNWERTIETSGSETTIDLGTFEICEHDELGETNFQIDGDGYDNATISIVQNINIPALNGAMYNPAEDMTVAYAADMSDDISIGLVFYGKELGERTGDEFVSVSIRVVREGVETLYWAQNDIEGSSLNLAITKYEDIGGVIEGTFSGTFLVNRDGAWTGTFVTITNGKFSVIRAQDLM